MNWIVDEITERYYFCKAENIELDQTCFLVIYLSKNIR